MTDHYDAIKNGVEHDHTAPLLEAVGVAGVIIRSQLEMLDKIMEACEGSIPEHEHDQAEGECLYEHRLKSVRAALVMIGSVLTTLDQLLQEPGVEVPA